MATEHGFWTVLEELFQSSTITVDRPAGSAHPRFPELIYPLDYGYLDGTTAGDGQGIDVVLGNGDRTTLTGVALTADSKKRDTETKLLLGCTAADFSAVQTLLGGHPS